uniref:Borealin-2 n=2 Tax=Danio rerio TaxID=7955 RepID=BORE2_DANRE|nr:RecName: Full=Borealin-2; AltName: Full=Cell division cycle-associated protein 8.2; AltName: Full=Cell division cycle-associated protein 9; AltName: Full=Dasra-A; Short=DrDasraA [Danio rerio]
MAPRRTRKVSQDSDGQADDQHSFEQKIRLTKRKELFIQQFEKEAQDRINEMEANLNKLLATVDRVFKIELMKMPLSLHTTLIKDLMNDDDTSVGEVTMALKCASPEIQKPLSRKPSKKALNALAGQQRSSSQSKTPIEGQKKPTKKTLHSSKSTGSLRCASTINAKRTQGRVVKLSDQANALGVQFRQTSRSVGDELMMATATIVTSHGETLFLSEDNKDEINVELLDDAAVNQMRKIKELMDYLCNKVRINNTC